MNETKLLSTSQSMELSHYQLAVDLHNAKTARASIHTDYKGICVLKWHVRLCEEKYDQDNSGKNQTIAELSGNEFEIFCKQTKL